ncbi:MAG: hypothetical protein AAF918_16265 [Pseudomonadota bacterium]
MRLLTITDFDPDTNFLSFDLIDILMAIKPTLGPMNWRLNQVECVGAQADVVHKICDEESTVTTAELIELAKAIDQTIDGEFCGYPRNLNKPTLCIRAVDSDAFDIETNDISVIALLMERFERIHEVV